MASNAQQVPSFQSCQVNSMRFYHVVFLFKDHHQFLQYLQTSWNLCSIPIKKKKKDFQTSELPRCLSSICLSVNYSHFKTQTLWLFGLCLCSLRLTHKVDNEFVFIERMIIWKWNKPTWSSKMNAKNNANLSHSPPIMCTRT